ncbi:MAG: hypothetical protein Kow00128_12420 [Deltaproteobacteria bacterium]
MNRYRITVAAAGAVLIVSLWVGPGCYRSAVNAPTPPPTGEHTPETVSAPKTTAAPEAVPSVRGTPLPEAGSHPPARAGEGGETERAGDGSAPETATGAEQAVPGRPSEPVSSPRAAGEDLRTTPKAEVAVPVAGPHATGEPTEAGTKPAGADESSASEPAGMESPPVAEEPTVPEDAPLWARDQEELVYRVEFLGLTMGYAQFHSQGVVRIGDRLAYRLTVRAWTTDLLSVFYPMNDTIDYYLDVETLAPIRLEFTNSRSEDDIAYYDQETGRIVYRYKKSGKIRKEVRAVPGVYDPVSVAYYFRTRDLSAEEPARPMYAGRKLWEVSARPLGTETIRTERGLFDTVMIEPVIRRNGNQEHKGNLRIWMTRDPRHVPVRLYAKFKKIRTWTLVGELVPGRQGG